MTVITRFSYSNPNITAERQDEDAYYAWLAFAQEEDGFCHLKKTWLSSPDQIFFDLEREVESINAIDLNSTHVFVAYQDDELLGERFSKTNPVTSSIEISIPSGIVDSPVDVKVNGTDLFFLLPGSMTGENAKILVYNTSGVYSETIDLARTGEEVLDAISFTIDDEDEIWVATSTDPSTIVRVFQNSGSSVWEWEVTQVV